MPATFKASHNHARTTARKARLVIDMIRGMPVNTALRVLDRSPRRAAVLIAKVVRSAVANAEQDEHIDPNQLMVETARVDEGPLLGGFLRWRPGARGRAMPIRKRTAHIHVVLAPHLAPAGKGQGGDQAAAASGEGQAAGKAKGAGKRQGQGGKAGSAAATQPKAKAKAKPAGKTPKTGKDD
jgi:large subunit ribosomal protein L22